MLSLFFFEKNSRPKNTKKQQQKIHVKTQIQYFYVFFRFLCFYVYFLFLICFVLFFPKKNKEKNPPTSISTQTRLR